jgi:hypothetical protein
MHAEKRAFCRGVAQSSAVNDAVLEDWNPRAAGRMLIAFKLAFMQNSRGFWGA